MRNSSSKNDKGRRRSWFLSSTNIFSIFSSAPSSPQYNKSLEEMDDPFKQRSQSLTPIDTRRPAMRSKSSFSLFLSKKKKQLLSGTSSRRNSSIADSVSSETLVNTKEQIHIFNADEAEADRLQLKNDLVKLAFEGEFCLPFDYKDLPHGKILDVGCGPGAWCIDLATKYSQLQVIGIDSDDMFPSERNLPPNCQLFVCNVLNGLNDFPNASFDVIHIRFMVLSFTLEQYSQVVKDCWRLLKPGGYIEILETDLTIHSPGPVTKKLNEQMMEVTISKGLNPNKQTEELKNMLPEESINIEMKYRSIPMGVWGGRIGVLCRDDMIYMLTRFQPYVQSYYNVINQNFEQDILNTTREMDHYKSFSNYFFCTAQKPHSIPESLPEPKQPTYSNPLLQREYTSSFNPKSF